MGKRTADPKAFAFPLLVRAANVFRQADACAGRRAINEADYSISLRIFQARNANIASSNRRREFWRQAERDGPMQTISYLVRAVPRLLKYRTTGAVLILGEVSQAHSTSVLFCDAGSGGF
jgi:hypothetical protein